MPARTHDTNTMYTLQRAPLAIAEQRGITIEEIELTLKNDLCVYWGKFDLQSVALLFAILKVGSSIPKLEDFTDYHVLFIRAEVERLRSSGHLYTGTLSSQFVLGQVPGSEDLIERITGQRPYIEKESIKMSTKNIEEDSAGNLSNLGEYKPKRGRPAKKRQMSPEAREKISRSMKAALAARKARLTGEEVKAPLKAKASVAAVENGSEFYFQIKYIDNDIRVELKGDSLAKLNGALNMINEITKE